MLVVPLKFMCSTQWETPVRPGGSSLEPTLYQHQTDASGAVCSSRMRTVSPLARVVSLVAATAGPIRTIIKLPDTHARVERHRQPASHRLSDESQPSKN